jgi:CBS domain-containing protein
VHAGEIADPAPVVRLDDPAMAAVRLVTDASTRGVVVVDDHGRPVTLLTESQLIGLFLPRYLRAEPSLAHVVDEEHADRFAQALSGATVRTLLPQPLPTIPAVRDDDTLVEAASVMDSLRSPLVAVIDAGGQLVGVVTASRLLSAMLPG